MKKEYIETSGWDAITRAFEKLYPEQTDPLHYAPIISWRLGGEDPLDGISVYDGGDYYHFVTYGLLNCMIKNLKTLITVVMGLNLH